MKQQNRILKPAKEVKLLKFTRKAKLTLFVFVLGVAAWVAYVRDQSSIWYAVSPTYVEEALSDTRLGSSNPVPFCFNLDSHNYPRVAPQCERYFEKFPQSARCGVQNLSEVGWDPSVTSMSPLSDPRILRLLDLLDSKKCREIVLDVESLSGADIEKNSRWYADLIRRMRERLSDPTVVVAVHAKTDNDGTWEGARAQEWSALCQSSDELLIMAYDYNFPGKTPPGETAPPDWVGKVLHYGMTKCPANKLRLGLAAYGYNWDTGKVLTERESRPGDLVETEFQRSMKIRLARKLGIRKFFVWALGMEKPQ